MRDRFESLSRLLEAKSPIDIDGTPHAVWVIESRDPSPLQAQSVVLIGARSQSQSCNGELHLTRDHYTDEEIVELAINLMKRIVRGELPGYLHRHSALSRASSRHSVIRRQGRLPGSNADP
jgi:hypothetical protein